MRIQQIRNATLKVEYDGITFLIDPWLQDKGTGFSANAIVPDMVGIKMPLNDLPFSPEEILSGVDYCVVTHIHPDHFTADYLPKGIRVILQNKADAGKAADMGFYNTLSFFADVIQIEDITIQKVKAIHGNTPQLVAAMGECSGYVFKSSKEPSLYIAGDTVLCDAVRTTITVQQPDVIVLNCCAASNPMGRLLMNEQELFEVCRLAPNAKIIASHLDSVNHALLTSEDIQLFVKQNQLKQVYVPHNGECLTFS